MDSHKIICSLRTKLRKALISLKTIPPTEEENRFVYLLLDALEDSHMREYRYEVLHILLAYFSIAKNSSNLLIEEIEYDRL